MNRKQKSLNYIQVQQDKKCFTSPIENLMLIYNPFIPENPSNMFGS